MNGDVGRGEKGRTGEVVDLSDDRRGCEVDVAGKLASPEAVLGLAIEGVKEEMYRRRVAEQHGMV